MVAGAAHDGWLGRHDLVSWLHCYNDEQFDTDELRSLKPFCRLLAWRLVQHASPHSTGAVRLWYTRAQALLVSRRAPRVQVKHTQLLPKRWQLWRQMTGSLLL